MVRTSHNTRTMIMEYMKTIDTFISAQDVYTALQTSGKSIGLTTVYRNIQGLANDGELDTLQKDSEILYRKCTTTTHHHHLVCVSCGSTQEIHDDLFEQWNTSIEKATGYTNIHHQLELSGLCEECA
ncbi:MAG: transcriptional repressor [Actinomycetaceae bacterium]|nr:transcriptional repressor [Actinomycetaceae bacterium]